MNALHNMGAFKEKKISDEDDDSPDDSADDGAGSGDETGDAARDGAGNSADDAAADAAIDGAGNGASDGAGNAASDSAGNGSGDAARDASGDSRRVDDVGRDDDNDGTGNTEVTYHSNPINHPIPVHKSSFAKESREKAVPKMVLHWRYNPLLQAFLQKGRMFLILWVMTIL